MSDIRFVGIPERVPDNRGSTVAVSRGRVGPGASAKSPTTWPRVLQGLVGRWRCYSPAAAAAVRRDHGVGSDQ